VLSPTELDRLPDDRESLQALLRSVMRERDQLYLEHLREQQRANDLHLQKLLDVLIQDFKSKISKIIDSALVTLRRVSTMFQGYKAASKSD